ncbi:MAG: translocation/assembly module TamB domain-containing protein [Pseudomonadota bacterium]|nr:translocation/assembly module TamB domain-containing protein [Pseudomonadota bacterium]
MVALIGSAALVTAIVLAIAAASPRVRDAVVEHVLFLAGARASAIEGRLTDRLILSDVELDSGRMTVGTLVLAWRPLALLRGELVLQKVAIADLNITLERTAEAPGAAFSGIELPLPIRIEAFTIEGARLHGEGALAGLTLSAAAQAYASDQQLTLPSAHLSIIDASDRTLHLAGAARLELSANLPWSWTGTGTGTGAGIADGQRSQAARAGAAASSDLFRLEASLKLEGTLRSAALAAELSAPLPLRLTASIPDLSAPTITADAELLAARAFDAFTLASATAHFDGALDRGSSSAAAVIEVSDPFAAEHLPINLALSGEQDARGLMFTLQAVSKHLRLDATGRTLIPSGRTDAKLHARLDARAPRSNSHALAFDASTDVLLSPADATLRLSDGALTGTLDGRPVSLEGRAALSLASNLRANALDVTGALGSNRLRIQKEAGTAPEAAVRIDLADLTEIHPDMRGRGRIEGRVGGTLAAPDLSVFGVLDGAGLREVSIAQLRAQIHLAQGLRGEGTVNLEVIELTHPRLAEPAFASLTAQGPLGAWPMRLDAKSADASIHGEATLSVEPSMERIAGEASVLNVRHPSLGVWKLEAPTVFSYGGGTRFSLAAACMTSAPAHLCTSALAWPLATDADIAEVRITALPAARVAKWLPAGVQLDGALAGNLRYAPAHAALNVEASGLGLVLQALDAGRYVFEDVIEELSLRIEHEDDALIGAARVHARNAGSVALEGRIDHAESFADSPLEGRAQIDLDALEVFEPFLDGLKDPAGSFQGELRVSGTAGRPRLSGQGGGHLRIEVPAIGRVLDLPAFTVWGVADEGLKIEGAFDVDGIPLRFDGALAYDAEDQVRAALSLRGDDVPLVALPDLALWLSPHFEAELQHGMLSVNGTLGVPRARIAVTSVPEAGAARSQDVILHRKVSAAANRGVLTQARVEVHLGEDVQLTAGALSTGLTGNLALALGLDRSLTAQGHIDTRGGTVSRFGRELAITTGSLAFDGSLMRPEVSVTAGRVLGGQEVGVTIAGPPDALETSLYATPPLDDGAALSMLVTGRAPDAVRPEDKERVSAAAFSLGVGAANPYLQGFGERLGLKEFGVDTGTGALVAGTRLSERLYARYNFALTTRASGVQIEYKISDRLSARTETGPVHALDLLYRREFD